ncbi:MAG: sodium:proton antiporter NhaD [Parachlamydiaceae bacterium]
MISHQTLSFLMTLVFVIGYFLITIEHYTKVNKATCALLMAVLCWIIQFEGLQYTADENIRHLGTHVSGVSQVVFFLIGALTIVETINVHQGFKIVSDAISVSSKKALLWATGLIAFFLSSVLDNLTTTIVMVTILQKLLDDKQDRMLIGGGIVIAANAGGAWTSIGDVTTTMLWIGGQISSFKVMKELFLPSLACFAASFFILSLFLKGAFVKKNVVDEQPSEPGGTVIFCMGLAVLIFVPIFKALTGLPPFMGVLFGLGILWLITDFLHSHDDKRSHLRIPSVLTKIDLSSVIFFLGILLCVDALETAGILEELDHFLGRTIGNLSIIAVTLGVASAVIDNVPLVAAAISMYDFTEIPKDASFWHLIAYTAGTGGSLLIIGSAAGVVYMGLEKVDFFWYLKRISLSALVGYVAGLIVYFLTSS